MIKPFGRRYRATKQSINEGREPALPRRRLSNGRCRHAPARRRPSLLLAQRPDVPGGAGGRRLAVLVHVVVLDGLLPIPGLHLQAMELRPHVHLVAIGRL